MYISQQTLRINVHCTFLLSNLSVVILFNLPFNLVVIQNVSVHSDSKRFEVSETPSPWKDAAEEIDRVDTLNFFVARTVYPTARRRMI